MKRLITILLTCVTWSSFGQRAMTSEGLSLVRIATKEKQHKPAGAMVQVLLEAWCNGDIAAYYPHQPERKVSYAQFLYHFGMQQQAYTLLDRAEPAWFCSEQRVNCPMIDPYELTCLQEEVELAETNRFNAMTSRQEKRIHFVKLIYAAHCMASGIEMEGPVFYMKDIRRLPSHYRVPNPQNDAASLPVWSYLKLGNYSAAVIQTQGEWVDDPAKETSARHANGVQTETSYWDY